MTPWRTPPGRPFHDILPVLLVGLLVFHVLRTHVAERYLVPSPSMEPTLHGSERGGDVVLVDKTAFWRPGGSELRALDLVVVQGRDAEREHHIVKRLIAEGPTEVALRDGDVFLRDPATGAMQCLVKPPLAHPDLRLTAFTVDVAADEGLHWLIEDDSVWFVDGGSIAVRAQDAAALSSSRSSDARRQRFAAGTPDHDLPHHLSTAQEIDTSFLTSTGVRLAVARGWPRDIGLAVRLTIPSRGVTALDLVVEHLEVYYCLRYAVDGGVELSVMGEPTGEPVDAPPLPVDTPVDLAFGYLDGRWFVTVDDVVAFWQEFELPVRSSREPRLPPVNHRAFVNRLHIGAIGGEGVRLGVERLRAFHDVHYEPVEKPFELEEGQLFLLGDNAYDSSDSRARGRDPYDRGDLVGRPVVVLAPAGRVRWL